MRGMAATTGTEAREGRGVEEENLLTWSAMLPTVSRNPGRESTCCGEEVDKM